MALVAGEELKVIDVDAHFSEPYDLWTSRAPAKYKDLVPHAEIGADGLRHWLVNGDEVLTPRAGGGSVYTKDGSRVAFWDTDIETGLEMEEVHESCYDVKARLEVMDNERIWAEIVYPNTTGFAAHRLMELPKDLAIAIVQIYNDSMAEKQEESGGRLFPMALIPFWDIDAAVKETERISKELHLHGITMSAEPHRAKIPMPDLLEHHWDPLWDACTDLGLPVNFHVGSSPFAGREMLASMSWPSLQDLEFGDRRSNIVFFAQLELNNARVVANLISGDLILRYPKISWVSVESGIGWIPYILERLEWQLQDSTAGQGYGQPGPTELFRRSVYSCFWFEDSVPKSLIDVIGVDNVMFETDYPHPTCLHPGAVTHAEKVLADWSPEVRRKVLQDNAARVYHIDL